MSLHSIIEHRANYYFLKLEEDYVEICQGKHKHCKAAILSILENWMNSKRATTSRESDLYVYLSYPQFVKQMFGLYERSTVITSLKELEQEGLILKRPFKDVFNQVTFEYRLNCSVVQQELFKLSDKPATGGSVNLNGGSVEIDGGSFENKRGGSVNLDDPPFKNKRNIEPTIESNIEPTENTEREVADATARPPLFYSMLKMPTTYEDALIYLTPHGLEPISGLNEIQVVKLAQKLWIEAHEDDEDTVEREAVKASQKDVAHVQNQTHSGNPGNSSQPHLDTNGHSRPLDASLTSQTEHRKDTNKVTEPPAPRKPPSNPVPRRPKQQGLMDEIPASPASKPVEPHAEMTWGTRKCLQWFDYWRGGTLIAKYKLQQAASCAKGLAEQFDEKTVIQIRSDMADDPYYIERGGPDICDVANNIHKYLNKKKPKKEPSNEHKATQQPANAFIERCLDKDYNKKKLEWMREENARRRQAQAEGVQ